MHFLGNTEREEWIEEYVDRETTVGRKQVEDADTAIIKKQGERRNLEQVGLTMKMPEKKDLKRCRMLSKTVWAILEPLTIRRMEKTRKMMMKTPSWTSCIKMTNLAGWRAQSPKCYSCTCSYFSRSSWGLTNWLNRDGGTWPTSSVREIWRTGRLNWMYWQLLNCKQPRLQPHLHQQQLESLCWLLISSLDNCKWRQGLLNQKVVSWGWVRTNHSHINASHLSCLLTGTIHPQLWHQSLLNS